MKKILVLVSVLLIACTNSTYDDIVETDTTLKLKWNKSYEGETIEKAIIGLQWALSYLGATLPLSGDGIENQFSNYFNRP